MGEWLEIKASRDLLRNLPPLKHDPNSVEVVAGTFLAAQIWAWLRI